MSIKQEAISTKDNMSIKQEASSIRSTASSRLSRALAFKQAQVEATRVRVQYAEKEAAMKKKKAMIEEQEVISNAAVARFKAELDADLDLLGQQKEAAAAQAEVDALESNSEGSGSMKVSLPEEDPMDRVKQFVDVGCDQSYEAPDKHVHNN